MLLERFGEPIVDSSIDQDITDERNGNRGPNSKLQNEDICCQQCGSMPKKIGGRCCNNLT